MEDDQDSRPRLWTLERPFEEFKVVGECRASFGVGHGLAAGAGLGIGEIDTDRFSAAMTVLFCAEDPSPLLVIYDQTIRQIVFYRRRRITLGHEPSSHGAGSASIMTARTMRPEELLQQHPLSHPHSHQRPHPPSHHPRLSSGEAPAPAAASHMNTRSRPSLNRLASGSGSNLGPSSGSTSTSAMGERRVSSRVDPLDRTTRRAPRLSRGAAGPGLISDSGPASATGELQATLDPPPVGVMSGSAVAGSIASAGQGQTAAIRARGFSGTIQGGGSSGMGFGPENTSGTTAATTTTTAKLRETRRTSGASAFLRQEMKETTVPLVANAHANAHAAARMALHGAVEKDLRETTMMMGLDKEEKAERSEVVLEKVGSWKPPK